MHIADINGRIYERNKRQSHRQFVFSAWCVAIVAMIALVLFWQ